MIERGAAGECDQCGAPPCTGLVACPYCKSAYAAGASGVACPKCGDLNRRENAQCASCHASLARACVFCGGASSLTATACTRCGEAFAGADDRKRARDEAARQQQSMKMVGKGIEVVGQLASNRGVQHALGGIFETLIDEATKASR